VAAAANQLRLLATLGGAGVRWQNGLHECLEKTLCRPSTYRSARSIAGGRGSRSNGSNVAPISAIQAPENGQVPSLGWVTPLLPLEILNSQYRSFILERRNMTFTGSCGALPVIGFGFVDDSRRPIPDIRLQHRTSTEMLKAGRRFHRKQTFTFCTGIAEAMVVQR
jgi:hypothetical protein